MKPAEQTGRLSMRNSILVWVAVLTIGWGCAVVLFYQLIRGSDQAAASDLTAQASPEELSRIETAAGGDKRQHENRVRPENR